MSDEPKSPNCLGFEKRSLEQREKLCRNSERVGHISAELAARIPGGRDNPELHREFYWIGGHTPTKDDIEGLQDEKE